MKKNIDPQMLLVAKAKPNIFGVHISERYKQYIGP